MSSTPQPNGATSEMAHCHCANCDTRLGTYENEWTRLSASYIVSKSKGTHRLLAFAKEKRLVQPSAEKKAVEGCILQEAQCGGCKKVVGALCVGRGSPSQDYLVDKMFFKSARIYLRDRITSRKVDPMFDVQHLTNTYSHLLAQPSRKTEHADDDGSGVLASVEDTSAREYSRPPSQQGMSEGVLLLRRLTSQGQDIQRVSSAVKKLEKEMREVKKMLAITSGDPATDFGRGVDLMSTTLKQLNPKTGELARLQAENDELRRQLQAFTRATSKTYRGGRTNDKRQKFNEPTAQDLENEAGYDFDAALVGNEYLDRDDSFSSMEMPDGSRFARMSGSFDPADNRNLETQMRQARVGIFGGEEIIDTLNGTMVPPKPDKWTLREEQMVRILRDCGKTFAVIATYFPKRSAGAVRKHWYTDMDQARPADSPFTLEDIDDIRASLGLEPHLPNSKLRRGPGRPRRFGLGNVYHIGDSETAMVNPDTLTEAQLEEEQQYEQHFQARTHENGAAGRSTPPNSADEVLDGEMPIDPALLNIGREQDSMNPTDKATEFIKEEFQSELLEASRQDSERAQVPTADSEQPQASTVEEQQQRESSSSLSPPLDHAPGQSEYPPLTSPKKAQPLKVPNQTVTAVAALSPSTGARANSVLRSATPTSSASRVKPKANVTRKAPPQTYKRKSARVSGGGATANGTGVTDLEKVNANANADGAVAEETEEDREKKRREKIAARDLLVKNAMEREELTAA